MKPKIQKYRHYLPLVSLFIIASLVLGSVLVGLASAPQPPDDPGFRVSELPESALRMPADFNPAAARKSHPKMDTALFSVGSEALESAASAAEVIETQQLRTIEGRVQVQVHVLAERAGEAAAAIDRAGGVVTGRAFGDTLLQAWVPAGKLLELAELEEIQYLRRPSVMQMEAIQATTEGLAVMNGTTWHTAGYEGAGVKVGIIDGGFEGYTALLGSDLPAVVTVKNFVDGETDPQVDGTTPHGTACTEIIADIAPAASLYLAKINTLVDLEEAVVWLRDTHQVDVISMSGGYLNVGPGDGTGPLADLVQSARDAGILWVNAAGNYRERHWGGEYYDPDQNDYHNFNGTQEINFFGPGDDYFYLIPEGVPIIVELRWDDWTNVDQDFDLYLVRFNGSSWDIVYGSEDVQDGSPGQTPTESFAVATQGDATGYGFIIHEYDSTHSVNFEVVATYPAELDEQLHARSLSNPADAPAAFSVAALDVLDPFPQEPYSSEGPTNGPGGTAEGGALKPDIAGFANVTTVSYGSGEFNGTSSATPHVAGAAALVKNAYPAYGPDELQTYLEGQAVDMGAAGKDTVFGAGRLYLGEPPAVVTGRTWTGAVNDDWHNAANWTPEGVPTSGDEVTIPNVSTDPRIYNGDAQVGYLTIAPGAALDLTTRSLSVEGTITNTGTLVQTREVTEGQTTEFLALTNSAGTEDKYFGLEISPTAITPTISLSSEPVVQSAPAGSRIEQLPSPRDASGDLLGLLLPPEAAEFEPGQAVELKVDSLPSRPGDAEEPIMPMGVGDPVSLELDDGVFEALWGVNNSTNAYQFIWLNRFTPDPANFPLVLNQIQVLFWDGGGGTNVHVGDAIDLVVYTDSDGDPSNGAAHLATFNETIQAVNGTTWSVYNLASPVTINDPGDVLIGVINRYVDTGVTLQSWPATMDQTISQDRSWMGWWTSEPPDPPLLPPDYAFDLMTGVEEGGNFMIRGYGEVGSATVDSTQVTVAVSGEQYCPERLSGVRRCYDINPADAMDAAVRLYFRESERAGYDPAELLFYHYDAGWLPLAGPFTSGGSGEAIFVEGENIHEFSPFALDTESPSDSNKLFLPLLLQDASVPLAPVLNPIENADGDPNYTVSWIPVGNADGYELQEALDAAFSSPTTIYTGDQTSQAVHQAALGTYFYRVRAANELGIGPWSNVESVAVTTEPVEVCETHYLGTGSIQWYIYSEGKSWDFLADNTMTVENIEVKSMLATLRGITFHISVRINGETVASWDQYVNSTTYTAYYHTAEVSEALVAGDTVTYHIWAYAGNGEAALRDDSYVKLCGR